MKTFSFADFLHYATAALALLLSGLAAEGIAIPGVTVDAKTAGAFGVGVLVAGFKGGIKSGTAAALAILVVLSLTPSSASAQSPLPTPPQVLQKIHDDAVASSQDAQQNADKIAQTCYDAVAADTQAKLSAGNVQGGGVILAFQKLRDLTRLNASPSGVDLIVGCAPLAQDTKLNLIQLFGKMGAAILLKGLIPGA